MSKKVTVLGTGIMGTGMAHSLAREGFGVTVWNRSQDKADALREQGISVATEPSAAVADADVLVTALFDLAAVTDVMSRALPSARSEAVWVQSSTVGLDGTDRLAALAADHGIGFVDAPVLGTRQPAEQGQLVVLAGGPTALRPAVAPVFDAIGQRTVWVGERPGDGHRLKLAANAWVLSVNAATAQSVGLATDLGLDPRLFLDVIAGGPLDCAYAQLKGKAMTEADFTPSFPVDGAAKDADLILDAMRLAGTNDGLMSALRHLYGAAADQGHGRADMAAVVTALSHARA